MSTRDKSSSKRTRSLFARLNIRFPWLKIVLVFYICFVATIDLLNLTISKTDNLDDDFPTTPMSKHVKATDRELNGKKVVALTFDDGPSSLTTPRLLDILSEKNTLATFFVLGSMARENPDIIKRMRRGGHEIASHTMYHQNLVWLSREEVESDINEAKSVLTSTLSHTPSLTRPPYGNYDDTVSELANTPLILWSVDTLDWQSQDVPAIINATMSQIHDGAIILMHDIYPTTVDAVPTIIDSLRENGYEFATISELAQFRHTELKKGESYYNFAP